MKVDKKPVWKEGLEKPEFSKLDRNIKTDVAIIGGGLAGVLTAYLLASEGKKVVLLEKKKIGSGATEYTTAFITQDVDTDLKDLVKLFGYEKARLVWQSGADATDLIEKIIDQEKIDCEFKRTPLTAFASDPNQYHDLVEEQKTIKEFGFDVSDLTQHSDLGFSNFGSFTLNNQAKFHPLKFLWTLASRLKDRGVEIFQESEVVEIKHEEDFILIETDSHQVEARQVIVATYQPFHNRIRLFLKRGMYRSYVITAKLPKNLIPEGLYLDNDNPYHYFRIDKYENYDQMILGGEDIKTIFKIDKEKSFNALAEYFMKILPNQILEISHRWVGPILEPSDGLALIGETYENEFVATAFSGNGMTYSAISALILTDQIMGRENIYAHVYDPKRIPSLKQLFIKGTDYMDEFLGGAAKNMFRKNQPEQV
jgi:glycine/D-amino acid oxidase-like deaminating enzyme